MNNLKVLISILNWNNWNNTVETVNSVLQSDYKNYKIIVLDNHSVDDSYIKIKTTFPGIEVWSFNKNLGYAGAHKKAASFALENNFDLLWILNNDVEVFPSSLKELIHAYERNGESLLGSVTLEYNGSTINFGGGLEMLNNYTTDEKTGYNIFAGKSIHEANMKERPTSGVHGSSFLIPASIIKKYGFMDTRFFLYGEETEYCYRLRKQFKIQSIIVPGSRVIHHEGQSFKSEKLKWVRAYYSTRNNNLVLKNYLKEYKIVAVKVNRIPHYLKYFLNHYFLMSIKKKDFNYWLNYYTELGNFHSFLKIKGKYLKPEKFLN